MLSERTAFAFFSVTMAISSINTFSTKSFEWGTDKLQNFRAMMGDLGLEKPLPEEIVLCSEKTGVYKIFIYQMENTSGRRYECPELKGIGLIIYYD